MPTPWNDDPVGSGSQIRTNAKSVILAILRDAPSRHAPSVSMAQDWHRDLYLGVPLPVSYYAGEVRETIHPSRS